MTPLYWEKSLALQKRFFDRFLKGSNNGREKEPPVAAQARRPDGATWRSAAAWPLPGTRPERCISTLQPAR
ncbi:MULTISPECIES: hypothetical protein [unclassified Rhizobium]|uniref:hypothetical protein n=1 Tax=unclassified Rhizobium TaxID=2613769 RepID=UPI0016462D31|nr:MULTISPECIES: hypothetical protein [unclassified Rhizobium]